jgi:aminoglycoside 3-N-acetyltransferase
MTDWDYSQEDLVSGLKSVGIKQGDTVLTYVSFGLLGRLKGGKNSESSSQILLNSFKTVLGENGTLLVPTYTYSFCNNEKYQVEQTPSSIGPFTEFFRQQENVKRSRNPIFSVAGLGPKTTLLLTNLPQTCFGKDCVYDRLTKIGGKICMIGLGLQWATFRHYIEQTIKIPARYSKKFSGNIVENNQVKHEVWDYFVRKLDDHCYPDGRRLEKKARELGYCKTSIVGRGEISQIDCKKFLDLGIDMLKQDPWFTVKGHSKLHL